MNTKLLSKAAFMLLLACQSGPARAGGCTLNSSGLAFGTYQPLTVPGKLASSELISDASISIVCSGISTQSGFTIALGPSQVGGGNRLDTRYLSNPGGGAYMAYNIFTNPTYSTIWGDGTVGSFLSGNIPQGDSSQNLSAYGRIPGGQSTLRVGSFSGSLSMTLTFNP